MPNTGTILSCQTPTQARKLSQLSVSQDTIQDINSQSSSMFQESDSKRFSVANHEVIISHTVIKGSIFQLTYIQKSMLQVKLMYIFVRLARIYISVVNPITYVVIS